MKKFLKRVVLFFGLPSFLLVGTYILTDPFETLRPFTVFNSSPNREFQSFELLKRNKNINYNSFIFGSSRCCELNTYQWNSYLPDSSKQFLFQSWAETLTGITQKIDYLEKKHYKIKNVLMLIDIPSSFDKTQESTKIISIKHYVLSKKTKLHYHTHMFFGYLKPSKIYQSINSYFSHKNNTIKFDTISNDWKLNNKFVKDKPLADSTLNKDKFINFSQKISQPLINKDFEKQLHYIKNVFDRNKTNYKIVLTPAFTKIKVNEKDLITLQKIFGEKNVYDYTGDNSMTRDKYNFFDINHLASNLGWEIIEDIYQKKRKK